MKKTASTENARHLKSASGGVNRGPHVREATSAKEQQKLPANRRAAKPSAAMKKNAKAKGYGDNVSGT